MTTPSAWRRFMLADDGIIDPIAVEIAARGIRPVALTHAERQLAAARILARGGTLYLIPAAADQRNHRPPGRGPMPRPAVQLVNGATRDDRGPVVGPS